ncbi:alpha-mannosidase [Enterococcus faecium]|nr:alpha-mannosidase [Enterococcus faecium]EGP5510375.1 alpha-mannosidase [Enterococcus faecium]EGV7876885.1 alpha-mannosidase [Enterococcus faecium]PQB68079.1 alpha-mannosidase [Enterococcus faecium]PQB99933.1 alpha-mannosidase [Enterococcus faecium]
MFDCSYYLMQNSFFTTADFTTSFPKQTAESQLQFRKSHCGSYLTQ